MDAVIFDMDGVILVDTEHHWHEEERKMYPTFIDGDIDTDAVIDELAGMYFKEIYDRMAEAYPVTVSKEEFVERFHEAAETVYGKATMMNGFPDLVSTVQEEGIPVAVATSSPRRWIDAVNDRFGLDTMVDLIVSAEDIPGKGKPAPDIYEHVADRLGVRPDRCIVIEDSLNGVKAATAAGMYTVAFSPDRDEARRLADKTADTPETLRTILLDRVSG